MIVGLEKGSAMRIDSANVKDALEKGGTALIELFRTVLDEQVTAQCEGVYEQTIELGMENTIRALFVAEVEDGMVLSALHEVWGLPGKEAAGMVAWTKRKIAVERLEEFLLLKGLRAEAVKEFRREYAVLMRLGNNKELLALWDKPDQLYSKLLKMGKDPRPVVHRVSDSR